MHRARSCHAGCHTRHHRRVADQPPGDAPAPPPLPERAEAERLRELDEGGLDAVAAELQAALRAVTDAMAPYERHAREIRSRMAELSTERRRRERSAHVARRADVREGARSGTMPSLEAAMAVDGLFDDATPLSALHVYLGSGGEVGFGFATRPGTITFTDGRQQRQARSWGDVVTLHRDGWDPGAPGIPGVRIHLAGTRVERVVAASEVVLRVEPSG